MKEPIGKCICSSEKTERVSQRGPPTMCAFGRVILPNERLKSKLISPFYDESRGQPPPLALCFNAR